jgi:hypothetical protein
VVDTRSTSLRTKIVNASGNLASNGRLLAGHSIAINLDSPVYYAEAVFGNLTVTDTAAAGFVTIWSGATTSVPTVSTINFGAGATLSNFFSSGISAYNTTITNVLAVYAEETTHVILDRGRLRRAGLRVPDAGSGNWARPWQRPAAPRPAGNPRRSPAQRQAVLTGTSSDTITWVPGAPAAVRRCAGRF